MSMYIKYTKFTDNYLSTFIDDCCKRFFSTDLIRLHTNDA